MSEAKPPRKTKKNALAHRYVDMWAFMGVHPTNIEFLQRLKMADDRQFGANMDVCGTVSEKDLKNGTWEKAYLVGIRTDAWNPSEDQQQARLKTLQNEREVQLRKQIKSSGPLSSKQMERWQKKLVRDPIMRMQPRDLESRRLVMKLFRTTSERMRWTGTIEEMVTREIHNSLGSRRAVLTFATILNQHGYLTLLQENHRTFRIPSIFTFCYCHEKSGRLWYVNIKRKWISIGADFTVEAEGRKIGEIDGALIGFGYNAHVCVYEPELAGDNQFLDLLTLFAASVGYQGEMRRSVKKRLSASRRGLAGQQIVEAEEFLLLTNPRKAA